MVQTVSMPKLGQTVEESTIVKWHKHEGEQVKKGEILFEIETDKAVLEVESFFEGTLLKIIVAEGQTVPVSVPVAFIGQPGDPIPDVTPLQRPPPAERGSSVPVVPAPADAPPPAPAVHPVAVAPLNVPRSPLAAPRHAVSPRARHLLRECAVSADSISGSGPDGRVVEKDVRAYLEANNYDAMKITPAAKNLARENGVDIIALSSGHGAERITVETVQQAIAEKPKAMSKMRQVIAQRLTESFTTTPHFYVTLAVDMTELLEWRQVLKKESRPFSVTDFILKAVALALIKFPALNSSTDGRVTRWNSGVHLGLAVSIDDGLVVPVIRNAGALSMDALHELVARLAIKARDGKLTPDEMSGGTFTVSNMSMLGVDNFTAIINPGESGILAVSSTRPMPVVQDGRIVIRSMMNITLSSDHRLVDGALAVRFVNDVKSSLENLELWKSMI